MLIGNEMTLLSSKKEKQIFISKEKKFHRIRYSFYHRELCILRSNPGNTEQGKCWLTNEYPFFLFLIGCWNNETNILSFKNDLF